MALGLRLAIVRPSATKQEVMSPDLGGVVVTENTKEKVNMVGMMEVKLKLPAPKSPPIPTYDFQNF